MYATEITVLDEGQIMCHPNAYRVKRNGTQTCECKNGYEGNGFNCIGSQDILYSIP